MKFQHIIIDHKTLESRPFGIKSTLNDSLAYRHQDDEGKVWFVTTKGFGYMDSSCTNIAYIYEYAKKGVPAIEIDEINSDKNGNLWLATHNGILQFDPASEQFKHFGFERGLQGNSYGGVNHKGPSGKIYFGGYGGVNIFDPAAIKTNPYPPRMVFTGLKLDGKSIGPGQKSPIQQPIFVTDKITVGPAVDVISIDFAAIHFAADKSNQYTYKLAGFDKDWLDGGNIGNAKY